MSFIADCYSSILIRIAGEIAKGKVSFAARDQIITK